MPFCFSRSLALQWECAWCVSLTVLRNQHGPCPPKRLWKAASASEGGRLQHRRVSSFPMPQHLWPGGTGSGQHIGRWCLCAGRGRGARKRWSGYRPLISDCSVSLSDGRTVLRWVWSACTQDGLCVSVQLRDGGRALGLHHRLEPHPVLCHRWEECFK